MTITFYYDYICPFCFIGSKRIQKLSKELGLDIDWKGIEIHPEYSPEGKKRKRTQRTEHLTETLHEIAKEDGAEISLPGFVTNSRLCLEASEFAKIENRFLQFHNEAYNHYFNKGENIGKLETVLKIGETAGLDTLDLEEKLRSRSLKELIDENKKSADENVVMGVPTIYFNEFRVHGAQSTDVYRTIIKKHMMN